MNQWPVKKRTLHLVNDRALFDCQKNSVIAVLDTAILFYSRFNFFVNTYCENAK